MATKDEIEAAYLVLAQWYDQARPAQLKVRAQLALEAAERVRQDRPRPPPDTAEPRARSTGYLRR